MSECFKSSGVDDLRVEILQNSELRISGFEFVVIMSVVQEIRNSKSFQYCFHNVIAIFIFMIKHDDFADQPEGCRLEANGHEEDT